MKKSTLYAAYGSNLNLAQMEARCPGARVLGAGRISGYRLAFKRVGVCAFATIEPCQGEYVPVGIWEIGERNEAALDSYEGVPAHYGKETVEVEMAEGNVKGMVYVMNKRAVPALPGQGLAAHIDNIRNTSGNRQPVPAQGIRPAAQRQRPGYAYKNFGSLVQYRAGGDRFVVCGTHRQYPQYAGIDSRFRHRR